MSKIEDIKQAVSALTSLIQIHHERIDAYLALAEARSHDEIKSRCMDHVDTSMQIIGTLSRWRSAYDGLAQNPGRPVGTDILHEARLFLSFNRYKTMIRRCE